MSSTDLIFKLLRPEEMSLSDLSAISKRRYFGIVSAKAVGFWISSLISK
jgi:hypothetical protein